MANVAARRFDDHLPYNRLENVYEREGMRLGRLTLYGWLDALREHLAPLVKAMLHDARTAPYLCTDATGVLVQAPEQCRRGHFWVLVVPGRHVIYAFSESHNAAAVDKLLGGYEGFLVADAHAVYDHLYCDGGATEVACWGHARAAAREFRGGRGTAELGASDEMSKQNRDVATFSPIEMSPCGLGTCRFDPLGEVAIAFFTGAVGPRRA